MAAKLYVGNLPPETSEEQMRELFGSFGDVEEIAVFNKPGGDPGFSFVHFKKLDDADAALDALDNTEFHKYTITVQVSRTKGHGYGRGSGPPRPPGMRGPQSSYRRDRSYRSDYRDSSFRYGGGRDSHRDRDRGYDYPSRDVGSRSHYSRERGRYGGGGGDYYDKYSSSGRYGSSKYDRGDKDYYNEYNGRSSKYSDYRSRSPVSSRDYYRSDRDYDRGYRDDYREEGSRKRW